MNLIWTQLLVSLLTSTSTTLWDNPSKDHEIFNSSICMFADKTSMIDTFFHYTETGESKYQVFTAPLGFGKTTNLKMLKRFVQIEIDEFGHKLDKARTSSYKLFTNEKLAISNHPNTIKAHLAEYPVLYFDYSEVMEFSFPKTYRKICSKIHEVFKSHEWIYKILRERYSNSNKQDAEAEKFKGKLSLMQKMINSSKFENECIQKDCLCIMVEILYEYFQHQVFVFIEYHDRYWFDGENQTCKLWDMYTKTKFPMYQEVLYDLAYQLFHPKMSKYIKYVFATGTHPIYLQNDNFTYNTFLGDHPFTKYYGFTKEEVTKILNPRAKAPITELRNLRLSHNGYTTKEGDLTLFQPSSIIDYFPQSRSSSSSEHQDEKLTSMTYELNPYLLIDPPPLNGHWKVLKIQSILEKVKKLVSKGNVTFEIRFESSPKLKENSLVGLKNEPQTQKVTKELFFSMLFENGYLTYTTVPGCYRIPNQNRLKVLKHYLTIFEQRQQNNELDEVLRFWREYMKKNRLVR